MTHTTRFLALFATAVAMTLTTGCEKKTTKKVTVDTPTKTVEIEVEKTEKK